MGTATTAGVTLAALNAAVAYEAVTINSLGTAANTITAFTAGAAGNYILQGATALTLTNTTNVAGTVDAAGMTAGLNVVASGIQTHTINGSTVADAFGGIVAAVGNTITLNGNAGNDVVTMGVNLGNVVFNGGEGNDTLTAGAAGGAITVDGGNGIDTITLAAAAADAVLVRSSATTVANADIVQTFVGGAAAGDDFQYRGALLNGSTTGVTATSAVDQVAGASLSADIQSALGANPNATVFVFAADLTGAAATSLETLGASTVANLATNYAAFEANLVSLLGTGTITNLDAQLSATESVLFVFDNTATGGGVADQVIVRVTNTNATGNTLTANEIELVGVLSNVAAAQALAVDFIAS